MNEIWNNSMIQDHAKVVKKENWENWKKSGKGLP
jgi:hypothetical protein